MYTYRRCYAYSGIRAGRLAKRVSLAFFTRYSLYHVATWDFPHTTVYLYASRLGERVAISISENAAILAILAANRARAHSILLTVLNALKQEAAGVKPVECNTVNLPRARGEPRVTIYEHAARKLAMIA